MKIWVTYGRIHHIARVREVEVTFGLLSVYDRWHYLFVCEWSHTAVEVGAWILCYARDMTSSFLVTITREVCRVPVHSLRTPLQSTSHGHCITCSFTKKKISASHLRGMKNRFNATRRKSRSLCGFQLSLALKTEGSYVGVFATACMLVHVRDAWHLTITVTEQIRQHKCS